MKTLGSSALILGLLIMVAGFAIDPTMVNPAGFAPARIANAQLLSLQSNIIHAGGFVMVAGAALLAGAAAGAARPIGYELEPGRPGRAHGLDQAVRQSDRRHGRPTEPPSGAGWILPAMSTIAAALVLAAIVAVRAGG
jgi:hypothetical protein